MKNDTEESFQHLISMTKGKKNIKIKFNIRRIIWRNNTNNRNTNFKFKIPSRICFTK